MLLNGVVIGSTVEAAYYALVNDYHFMPTRKTPPVFYKKTSKPLYDTDNEPHVWNKINLSLGLASKRISFGDHASIRVSENEVKIVCDNVTFRYGFKKMYIFDPTGVQVETEIQEAYPKTFKILDDFELSNLGPKRYQLPSLVDSSVLAKEIHFYSSNRVDGANFITDCVVESELTYEQLNSFDYSDSIVRFIVERYLTSIGINGIFMKYYDSGKPKYRKPKVVHVKRLVFEKDNNTYKDTDSIKFLDMSLEEIHEKCPKR